MWPKTWTMGRTHGSTVSRWFRQPTRRPQAELKPIGSACRRTNTRYRVRRFYVVVWVPSRAPLPVVKRWCYHSVAQFGKRRLTSVLAQKYCISFLLPLFSVLVNIENRTSCLGKCLCLEMIKPRKSKSITPSFLAFQNKTLDRIRFIASICWMTIKNSVL